MGLGSTATTVTATAAATTKTTALSIQVLDNQRRRRIKIWIPKCEIQGQELDRYLWSSRQQGKALGRVVTNYYSYSATALVSNGSLVGIVVAVFLIWNARYMGNEFERLTENGIVIGDNEEEVTYGEEIDEDWSDCLFVIKW